MVFPHAGVVAFAVIPFVCSIALFGSGIFMYRRIVAQRQKAALSHIPGLDPRPGNTDPGLRWHPLLLEPASNAAIKRSASNPASASATADDMLVIRRSPTTLTNISALRGGAGSSRGDGSPRISDAGSSCLEHRSNEDNVARARHLAGSFEQSRNGSSSNKAGQQEQGQEQVQQLQRPAQAVLAEAPFFDTGSSSSSSSSSAAAAGLRDIRGSRDQGHAHVSIAVHPHCAAAGAAAAGRNVDAARCGQQQQRQKSGAGAEVASSTWLSALLRSAASVGQQQQPLQQPQPLAAVTVV